MDNYLGDLADIVRASGGNGIIGNHTTATATTSDQFGLSNQDSYQLIRNNDAYSFPADTLLRNIDAISTSSTTFLDNMGVDDGGQGGGRLASGADGLVQQVTGPSQTPGIINNGLCNIFSSNNMVQILPDSNNTSHKAIDNNGNNCSSSNNYSDGKLPFLPAAAAASPKVVKSAAAVGYRIMSNQMISMNNASCSSSPKGVFVDGSTTTADVQQLQIPSPRNHGIKRRKIQAKKVVCIPAPAALAANSRQTGEVVPSDLWAWRKYGQKPIKGSPYPRGYYRCSSSKGCSARKQVERSRTDPNMLVITYTSEHNHPWPTQRNALAGSTRSSQPASKTSSKASSPPSQKPSNNKFRNILIKEENENASTTTATTLSTVKEEETKLYDDRLDSNKVDEIIESYRPLILPEPKTSNGRDQQSDQDFFADLVEFESDDPLEIFGTQGCKGFDSFSGLFDWATNNNTPTNEENNDHTTLSLDQEKFKR
ncbi:probable WRKY transcription factor 35 [Chenopodium quinoa]|uniref:probable WRKY transcription factor 35 n=1 Tax=Chenopodium quinoa TaxID=63459 RepID=UPI000B79287C|nr:probable WRKY transcription factor 35 [Chenopodium quinoa]